RIRRRWGAETRSGSGDRCRWDGRRPCPSAPTGFLRATMAEVAARGIEMAETGKVAALVGQREIGIREFAVPEIADESTLPGIGLTGVCGSDLHRFQDVGEKLDLALPVVMGHEISGRVVKLGRRANEVMNADQPLREGDRVVVYAQRPCGQCYWCREFGHTARCVGPRPVGYGYRYGSVDAPPYFTGGVLGYPPPPPPTPPREGPAER